MHDTKKRRNTGQITLFDVAKYAGVGTMTVSRALRTPERVSDELREKIQTAVETLGYKPNMAASLLASASANQLIMIITTKIYDHNAKQLLDALQANLALAGYTTLIIETYHYLKREMQLLEAIYSHNLAAIVVFHLENTDLITQLSRRKTIPIINIGGQSCSANNIEVKPDDSQAMFMLTEHVIQQGYQYIGLLCANQQYHLFQQRLHGWHKAMLAHHLPTHRIINAAKPATFATGCELLPEILLNWPELDALICTTDELAGGVLYECQRRHIRVPYQIAVCGFGNSDFSQVCQPPLTTISLPSKQIGEHTAKLLLTQLSNKNDYPESDRPILTPMIHARASL